MSSREGVRMHVQSCPVLWDTMDLSLPGSSVHGILQARILEWIAIPSSRRSFWHRDRTHVSCVFCVGRGALYHWATWEAEEGWEVKLEKMQGPGCKVSSSEGEGERLFHSMRKSGDVQASDLHLLSLLYKFDSLHAKGGLEKRGK